MAFITPVDVYRVSGIPSDGSIISDNDILMHIEAAEAYVEKKVNTCLQPGGLQITETYDGNGTDTMFLNEYPIISLDSMTVNGTSVTTTNVWTWDHTGKIRLKSDAEKTSFTDTYPQLVSITYTYGQEASEREKHYAAAVAAMMTLTAQIGGTFDDVTSFSLHELQGSLGEPYTNIREGLNQMKQAALNYEKLIATKPRFG